MELGSAEVEVRHDATRGRGVYAKAALPANQVVLKDSPISVASAHEVDSDDDSDNETETTPPLVCCVCKRFVGSVPLQLHYLAGSFQLLSGMCSDERCVQPLPASVQAMTAQPTLPNMPPASTPVYLTNVVCSKICGDVLHAQPTNVFSSIFQRSEPFQAHNAVLKHLSLVTAILARIYYRLCVQARLSGALDWEAAVHDILHLEACPLLAQTIDNDAASAAHAYMLRAFSSKSKVSAAFQAHVDLAFFVGLLGRAKVNAVGVDVPSPIVPYFLSCEGDPATKADLVAQAAPLLERVLQKLCHMGDDDDGDSEVEPSDDDESNDESDDASDDATDATDATDVTDDRKRANPDADNGSDDEDEDIHFVWSTADDGSAGCDIEFNSSAFPSMDGTALFPRFSMLNHSCAPNCGFTYVNETDITVFTTQDVAPGDELTISYIERHAPVSARQADLRSRYNFTCACVRCTTELAAGKGKRKLQDATDKPRKKMAPLASS
ncbi:hypothetical protein SPRG_02406 [Saprolegnia parasitica CBS 223.65]|uniref:SET domain-containing protein n=1 Tax=Saprolegnia parasitica (strain CBS 223.65) TaxID=695850 RepID=A0A067D1V8_SAPPC|nr:hypothetical protein SPRG_02406 [Saprolegnia parasitica CBS 223.65]KDO32706.1 hypothetical protein SPRG_02406 [Saprolegnia parasitica CBS 223.65]|eukprot:XP_012196372.1 hypothetical protein SPRG_02406 [Saprolegnia parasitica CBS 223.65]